MNQRHDLQEMLISAILLDAAQIPKIFFNIPISISLLHDNKPVYRLPQQSIRRLAFVPPYSAFYSISFRCGGLSIERNQKPLTPESTLAITHHDKQKQVEVKRSSRVNPHEIRLFSGCPYYFTLPIRVQIHSATQFMDFSVKVTSKRPNAASHDVNNWMRGMVFLDMFATSL